MRREVGDAISAAQRRARERVDALEQQLATIVDSIAIGSNDDEHDPEGATVAYERQQIAALLADARHQVDELEDARRRVEAGTATTCERCGGSIPVERLLARPATRTCAPCAATSGGGRR